MNFPIPIVRLIISDEENRVLILKRSPLSNHAVGAWCLPGGKVEYNDTVETTIKKELREETSLLCTHARFLFYQDSLPISPGEMHCLNLYFECRVSGNVVLSSEASEYAWIGPSDLGKYDIAFLNDLGLIRYWNKKD